MHVFILEMLNQSITNIYDIGRRKNIKHFSKIFGNALYKPNFSLHSAASVRQSFTQKLFGDASVRLNRCKKYSVDIRLVS